MSGRYTAGARQRGHGSGWWKKISAIVEGEDGRWFWEKMTRKLGDGKETEFWEGEWAGERPLKDRFPRLFHLSSNQKATVYDMGTWEQGVWRWNIEWRRELRDTEVAGTRELVHLLQNFSPTEGMADGWEWQGAADGGFSVKKAYKELEKRRSNNQAGRSFPWPLKVWKSIAPFKAQVMGWRLLRSRLPTIDNLSKRVAVPEEEWTCCYCRGAEETDRHLFLDCPEAQKMWHTIIQWCGVCWVPPRTLHDHFESFIALLGGGKSIYKLSGLWICVVWVWWKWRNAIRFENIEWNAQRIVFGIGVTWKRLNVIFGIGAWSEARRRLIVGSSSGLTAP